jgi:hypothetical protein
MKRSTWIAVVIFFTLAGTLYYLNQREPTEDTTEITTPAPVEFLFSDDDGVPTSISIEADSGETVVISRNEEGVWVLEQPMEAEADQGFAEAAATQLTSLRIESRPEVPSEDVGLVQPSYTLIVRFNGDTRKTVRIGDLAPTEIGYYTSFYGSDEVLIVGKIGLDSLLKLVSSPPYLNTPTPPAPEPTNEN